MISKAGQLTRAYETDFSAADLKALANVYHRCTDIGACIASGSFKTMGMIIAPCSMKTLGEIAHGISSTLLTRAADVVFKRTEKISPFTRETPLASRTFEQYGHPDANGRHHLPASTRFL